jgi:hypothetical protein
MIKHSRIHADPYKCEICPAGFKFKRDLRAHVQEHIVADRMKKSDEPAFDVNNQYKI